MFVPGRALAMLTALQYAVLPRAVTSVSPQRERRNYCSVFGLAAVETHGMPATTAHKAPISNAIRATAKDHFAQPESRKSLPTNTAKTASTSVTSPADPVSAVAAHLLTGGCPGSR